MSSISSVPGVSAAQTASQTGIVMLKKANDQAKQEGRDMVQMLQKVPTPPPKPQGSLGHSIDVHA